MSLRTCSKEEEVKPDREKDWVRCDSSGDFSLLGAACVKRGSRCSHERGLYPPSCQPACQIPPQSGTSFLASSDRASIKESVFLVTLMHSPYKHDAHTHTHIYSIYTHSTASTVKFPFRNSSCVETLWEYHALNALNHMCNQSNECATRHGQGDVVTRKLKSTCGRTGISFLSFSKCSVCVSVHYAFCESYSVLFVHIYIMAKAADKTKHKGESGQRFRLCVPPCPRYIMSRDTHSLCVVCLGVKRALWATVTAYASLPKCSLWGESLLQCSSCCWSRFCIRGVHRWIWWREWRWASPYLFPYPPDPAPALWDRKPALRFLPPGERARHSAYLPPLRLMWRASMRIRPLNRLSMRRCWRWLLALWPSWTSTGLPRNRLNRRKASSTNAFWGASRHLHAGACRSSPTSTPRYRGYGLEPFHHGCLTPLPATMLTWQGLVITAIGRCPG